MTCKYKVKIKDIQYNYKVQMTDIQSKYKFKVFCTGGNKELEEKVNTLYEAWPRVSGEGETITLNDTINTTMAIDLKGNTSQEGTPTPETPQDIHVVSGDNSINVVGKNLLKNKATSQTINGVVFTVYDDGSVKIEGTATANTALPITGANNVFVDLGLQNGTYRLSGATGGAENTWAIYMAIKHSNNTTATFYNTNGDLIFTKTTGDTFFSVIRIENGTTVNQMFYPMIRVSSVLDNTYKPYTGESYPINLGDIELCKIGDYQDSIVKDNGKWYLNKQIGKVVLDGSENWFQNGTYPNVYGIDNFLTDATTTETRPMLSDYFTYGGLITNGSGEIQINKFYQWIGMPQRLILGYNSTSLADFKTWLGNNKPIINYPLNTPTYTEITDSTLLSQLNALAKSYTGQTNISQENNDLASLLNATALREMD